MEGTRDLRRPIHLNNLIYPYQGERALKTFAWFKSLLKFNANIKTHIAPKKLEGTQKDIKFEMNETVKRGEKTEHLKSEINNINTFYESRIKVIKLFDDYSRIVSEVKYKTKYWEGLKVFTSKQRLQRLTVALAHAKTGNTFEKLLNKWNQTNHIYFYIQQKKLLKKYTIM